ncbi:MAG: hypothetical protein HFF67_03035 [Oscillospiraceae bacterium]|nr:hypothetical protein [Oscillospiraceae bacterium]
MNKHLSVLAMWARSNLRRVLALLGLMAVLEAALFAVQLGRLSGGALEDLLKGVPAIAAITLQVYMFFLCYSGDEEKGVGYALGRLSIREETAILWKGVCNTAYLLLFWAVQTVLAVLFAHWYAAGLDPASRTAQTVFLAFYRVPFLHGLLPLGEWTGYVRNLLVVLGLGLESGAAACRRRRGGRFPLAFAMEILALTFFAKGPGELTDGMWMDVVVFLGAALSRLSIIATWEEGRE